MSEEFENAQPTCGTSGSIDNVTLAALERRRPDRVDEADWQHAVEDGRRFLIQWGDEAERLGWTAADLFGLPALPENPPLGWRRLARIDQLGLIWLTHARPVIALSAESARIATSSGGSVAFYRLPARPAGSGSVPGHTPGAPGPVSGPHAPHDLAGSAAQQRAHAGRGFGRPTTRHPAHKPHLSASIGHEPD